MPGRRAVRPMPVVSGAHPFPPESLAPFCAGGETLIDRRDAPRLLRRTTAEPNTWSGPPSRPDSGGFNRGRPPRGSVLLGPAPEGGTKPTMVGSPETAEAASLATTPHKEPNTQPTPFPNQPTLPRTYPNPRPQDPTHRPQPNRRPQLQPSPNPRNQQRHTCSSAERNSRRPSGSNSGSSPRSPSATRTPRSARTAARRHDVSASRCSAATGTTRRRPNRRVGNSSRATIWYTKLLPTPNRFAASGIETNTAVSPPRKLRVSSLLSRAASREPKRRRARRRARGRPLRRR